MARRNRDDRPTMIHCDRCGEDYSSTYKRCPFCEEMDYEAQQARYDDEDGYENGYYEGKEDYEEEAPVRRGGSRLSGGQAPRRGGGYGGGPSLPGIIARVVSVALIIAAAIIVITIIMPLVNKGHTEPGSSLPPESEPPVTESQTPGTEDTTPPVEESVQPSAQPTPEVPEGQTATGFTLNYTEFSFSDRYPDPVTLRATFTPAGTTGAITWTSSDPNVASVDANGRVSHGSVRGRATITASMPGAADQTCTVLNQVTSGTSSSGGGGTSTGTLSLNHTDFTFSALDNPSVQMRVNGTSSTPSWSIGNTAVATISADGVVRPAGRGTTTITCTVDGQTLTCIVRCSF